MPRVPRPPPPPVQSEDPSSDAEIDPRNVSEPVMELVHRNLGSAWKINRNHQMCYIFDAVVPARQWKRGTVYTDDDPWAEYGPPPWPDLTETDDKNTLKPYYPRKYERVYSYLCTTTSDQFLNWKKGQVKEIQVGKHEKRRGKGKKAASMVWTKREIPVIYVQLVCQLLLEDLHGETDPSHESLRRQSYARQVLDAAAKDIRQYKGPGAKFRSKILTPILQRYLRGVPDGYTPSIRAAIAEGEGEPTIADATQFYLAEDPVDPTHIPHYRRNLIHIVESRWYLGVLLGKIKLDSATDFKRIRSNHDEVMGALADESDQEDEEDDGPRSFSKTEVEIIVDEGLDEFFEPEILEEVKDQPAKKRTRSEGSPSPTGKRHRATSPQAPGDSEDED